ncbi:LLGL2 domain-containing protein [Ditylenchus destructor]|nr:LLGL2 domain-containing protein [Ditylenchus destructor]
MRRKLVSAIDGIRNLHLKTGDEEEYELEVEEKAAAQHFALANIVRHGFPDDPRCMAFDPVQRLLAIGGGRGNVRLLGQAGVDYYLKHDSDEPVLFAQFLVNEGGLITGLRDDTIHLWNYRQKTPEIVHSLKMAKERVTCVHLPFQSKWLHVGTDKGNVYFICLATFELSTYVINWNKAIDISCRTHPGCVKELSLCPSEPHRLLILYEKGHVVVWNLVNKEVERFAIENSPAKCIAWHHDGRQLMCGHKDGSLTIWNIKKPKELVHKTTPHSPNDSNACRPITHLSWNVTADGEQIIVFAGGMAADEGVLPALTVLRNKGSITVLEMDHNIVEMCALNSLPFNTVPQLPYGIAVLLKEDLLVIDSTMPGYPCFESPYPTDIHESPVTYLAYYADCPVDLIAALTLVGRNQRRQGVRLSEKPWPINGGVGRECATGQQEILLTGHEDGSIKFWQASSENLQVMYKLKTGRHFEKASSSDDVPQKAVISHAVTGVELCLDSRLLLVAGASGQVSLFRFVKTESCQDVAVVILPQLCSSTAAPNTPPLPNTEEDSQQQHLKPQRGASVSGTSTPRSGGLRRQADTSSSSRDSHSTDTSSGSQVAEQLPIKVRGGALRRPAGYQPELVCQIPWIGGLTPEKVTAMALNSAYGIVAIGTQSGIALVDIIASTQIYAWSNAELHDRPSVPLPVHLPASANSNATPPEAPSPQEPNNARSFSPLLARKPPPPRPPPPRLTIPNQQACSSSAQFCAVTPRLPHRQMSVPHSPYTNYIAHSVDVQIDRTTRRKANSSSCGNQIQPAHPGELENRDIARPNGLKLFPMSRSDSSSRDQLSTPGTPTSTHLATPPLLDLILTEEEEEYTDSTSECFTPPCSPSLTPTPESALRASSSFNQLSHLDIPQPLVQSRSSSELNDECIDNQIDRHRFASFNPSNPRKNSTSQHLAVSGRSNSLKMAATVVRKFTGKVRLGRSLSVQQKCVSPTSEPNGLIMRSCQTTNDTCTISIDSLKSQF